MVKLQTSWGVPHITGRMPSGSGHPTHYRYDAIRQWTAHTLQVRYSIRQWESHRRHGASHTLQVGYHQAVRKPRMSPAPFLAALSAISLPERQTCDGTHWKRTSVPRVTSWCLTVTICTSGIRSEGREYRPGVATSNLSTVKLKQRVRKRTAVKLLNSTRG